MHQWRRLVVLTAAASAACIVSVTGCGGGNSTTSTNGPGSDSGSDATASDSSSPNNDASQGAPDSAENDAETLGDAEAGTTTAADGGDASSETDSGGDSSAAADAASEGSTEEASTPDASDASSTADAGDGGVPDYTACLLGSGGGAANGYTVSNVCTNCFSGGTGDDPNCDTAYAQNSGAPYVCVSGSCVPGNCTSATQATDCSAPTPTCGFTTPNVCGGCTSDTQCSGGDVCNTSTGACVAATSGCAVAATDSVCTVNSADECCAGSCVPGNCCTAVITYCASVIPTSTCVAQSTGALGGICTTCPAVSGSSPVYTVDPVHGSDASGTGNTTGAGGEACAFQSITRALQVIGSSPAASTTINLVNSKSAGGVLTVPLTGGATETFPIDLPANVTLKTSTTVTGTNGITIQVPAQTKGTKATAGLVLVGASSGIAGGASAPLTISGQAKTANYGLIVESPSATIQNVTISAFANDGISVINSSTAAAALSILGGVQSTGNGLEGLAITGSSSATITPGSGAADVFSNNGQHGVFVSGTASISATGTVNVGNPATASSVIMSGNGAAGVWIETTSTTQSVLSGIVCTAGSANGVRIIPGASVQISGSWLLGNAANGVDIENEAGGTSTAIGNINLGNGTAAGNNVVQSSTTPNGAAGICLKIPATADESLSAQGNTFGAAGPAVTCTSPTTTALKTATNLACAGGVDVGGTIVHYPGDGGAGNSINVSSCTY
jgi:hypothetical protein